MMLGLTVPRMQSRNAGAAHSDGGRGSGELQRWRQRRRLRSTMPVQPCSNRPHALQELLKEMEGLAENGEWVELEAALQRVQGAPNDAATNLRYAAICAGPRKGFRLSYSATCAAPQGSWRRLPCCVATWLCPALRPCCKACMHACVFELAVPELSRPCKPCKSCCLSKVTRRSCKNITVLSQAVCLALRSGGGRRHAREG